MNTKILPINKNPGITSYIHYSYTNAIIDDDRIATVYIENMINHQWVIPNSDISYEIDKEQSILKLRDKKNRMSTSFYIKRKCDREDELIVKLDDVKILDNLTSACISIGTDEQCSGGRAEISFLGGINTILH